MAEKEPFLRKRTRESREGSNSKGFHIVKRRLLFASLLGLGLVLTQASSADQETLDAETNITTPTIPQVPQAIPQVPKAEDIRHRDEDIKIAFEKLKLLLEDLNEVLKDPEMREISKLQAGLTIMESITGKSDEAVYSKKGVSKVKPLTNFPVVYQEVLKALDPEKFEMLWSKTHVVYDKMDCFCAAKYLGKVRINKKKVAFSDPLGDHHLVKLPSNTADILDLKNEKGDRREALIFLRQFEALVHELYGHAFATESGMVFGTDKALKGMAGYCDEYPDLVEQEFYSYASEALAMGWLVTHGEQIPGVKPSWMPVIAEEVEKDEMFTAAREAIEKRDWSEFKKKIVINQMIRDGIYHIYMIHEKEPESIYCLGMMFRLAKIIDPEEPGVWVKKDDESMNEKSK